MRLSALLLLLPYVVFECLASPPLNAYLEPRDEDVDDPRTAEIIGHIESFQSIDWVDAKSGQYADFSHDMWNSAVANLTSMKKAKRAASPPPKSDLISSSSLPRRGLISDTTVPNGVKISDDQNAPVGRKHNFFSCYNSGQFGYDQTIAAFGVAGCAVVTNLLVEGVRVYVSPTWYEPSHGSGKLYLTLTKYAPKFLANAECVFLASWLPTYVCQAEKDTQTQGGKLAIYGNDVGSLTNGDKTMELKIDPNDCAGNVRCDDPPTTDIPPFTTPPKGGEP